MDEWITSKRVVIGEEELPCHVFLRRLSRGLLIMMGRRAALRSIVLLFPPEKSTFPETHLLRLIEKLISFALLREGKTEL